MSGHDGNGSAWLVQEAAFHVRGDPIGIGLVSGVPISYRDLALMVSDRGVAFDHTTPMWTTPGRQGFFVCQTTRFDRV